MVLERMDCLRLRGQVHGDVFREHRGMGVRAAASASWNKPAAAAPAYGRRRTRKSRVTVQPQTQRLVMENVVILKRGEPIPPGMFMPAAAAPAAEPDAPGADKCVTQTEKDGAPVAASRQSDAQAKKYESAAAGGQRGEPLEEPDQAAAAGDQCSEHAKEAEAAPTVYWGPATFITSADPRELPMPVLLLKPRWEHPWAY